MEAKDKLCVSVACDGAGCIQHSMLSETFFQRVCSQYSRSKHLVS